MFAANAVNASCEIMRVFWNCGSGSYAILTSCVSSVNTGWFCVLSLLSANGVFRSIILCLTGMCAGFIIVVNLLFDKAIVLTLVLSLLSRCVSYQSVALTVASYADTCVVITFEFGGSMPVVLTQVLR